MRHVNPLGPKLPGHRLSQSPQPKLADREPCEAGATTHGSGRSREDDAAATALQHGRQYSLGCKQPSEAVHAPSLLEGSLRKLKDAPRLERARVVQEHFGGAHF